MHRAPALALLIAVGLISGCASLNDRGASVDAPVDTTIAAVKAAPAQFHQKFIRVRGVINGCTPLDCVISQEAAPGEVPAADAASLSLGSAIGDSRPDAGADAAGRLFDHLYRFSDVTIVGRYDASCDHAPSLVRPNGGPGETETITVCADRVASLTVYRVLTVHSRWPATAFAPADGTLTQASPATARAVFLAYARAMSAYNPEIDPGEWKPDYRVLGLKEETGAALLCVCRAKHCDDTWPASLRAAIPAPANPYSCVEAGRVDGIWRFPPPAFD